VSLSDELRASLDLALAFAGELEGEIGDELLLTVGEPCSSVAEVLADGPARVVATRVEGARHAGVVALVMLGPFAEIVERGASDEILLTAAAPPLEAVVRALSGLAHVDFEIEGTAETDVAGFDSDVFGLDAVVYPILDGADAVACLVVAVDATSAGTAGSDDARNGVASALPSSFVLADVEMGVTAELGRCQMSVRELLSITPGAVIDLDRTAGSPVDVLVNGTLIARGEVVVIDEEFGIRISEIVPKGAQVR
jgi:flagellar motor switch protein FliN/FliY